MTGKARLSKNITGHQGQMKFTLTSAQVQKHTKQKKRKLNTKMQI